MYTAIKSGKSLQMNVSTQTADAHMWEWDALGGAD